MAIVVFDVDGTYTYFDKFVLEKGTHVLNAKYAWSPSNMHGYDIDEVFEINSRLQTEQMSEEEANRVCKKIKDDFWAKNYISYCLQYSFRSGVAKTIQRLKKEEGAVIVNVTSRFKTCRDDMLGASVRALTQLQFLRNFVCYDYLLFVPNDEVKMQLIRQIKPVFAVDDKPEMIMQFSEFTQAICIDNSYNENVVFPDSIIRTKQYDEALYQKMRQLVTTEVPKVYSFQKRMHYYKNGE